VKGGDLPVRKACTSVRCEHTGGGHCSVMMCGNYRGDCPVHA
jgi:hypothetical protein